jgi:hypothetical protein
MGGLLSYPWLDIGHTRGMDCRIEEEMNPYLQVILHNITLRLANLEKQVEQLITKKGYEADFVTNAKIRLEANEE